MLGVEILINWQLSLHTVDKSQGDCVQKIICFSLSNDLGNIEGVNKINLTNNLFCDQY